MSTEESPFPTVPCRFCQEPIIWAETTPSTRARSKAGAIPKPIPMDAKPDPTALMTISANPGGRPRMGEFTTRNQAQGFRDAGGKTYQAHAKTCTKIADWPKGGHIVKARARSRGRG